MTLASSAQPGDIITFGTYPQTASGTDKAPLRWRVLQNSGSELFVLSERIVDCRRYHGEFVDTTWRDCDLRKWLNEEFIDAAFDAAERAGIATTLCTDNGEGSPDAQDKIFLLSAAEVKTLTAVHGKDDSKPERRTTGTEFAKVKKADGCRLYVYDKTNDAEYVVVDGEKRGCSWWWLRTQLRSQAGRSPRTAFVGPGGSIRGYCRVNLTNYGVRPAMKLDLHR